MTVYTSEMITKQFSNKVHEYIHDGFYINMFTERYRSNNVVELIKPTSKSKKDVIRISLDSITYYDNDNNYKCDYAIRINQVINYDIVNVAEFRYKQLSQNLFSDASDYEYIKKLREQRAKNRPNKHFEIDKCIELNKISSSFREKIMNKIHAVRGMSRAKFNVVKLIHFHRNNNNHLCCEVHWHNDSKHGIVFFG